MGNIEIPNTEATKKLRLCPRTHQPRPALQADDAHFQRSSSHEFSSLRNEVTYCVQDQGKDKTKPPRLGRLVFHNGSFTTGESEQPMEPVGFAMLLDAAVPGQSACFGHKAAADEGQQKHPLDPHNGEQRRAMWEAR